MAAITFPPRAHPRPACRRWVGPSLDRMGKALVNSISPPTPSPRCASPLVRPPPRAPTAMLSPPLFLAPLSPRARPTKVSTRPVGAKTASTANPLGALRRHRHSITPLLRCIRHRDLPSHLVDSPIGPRPPPASPFVQPPRATALTFRQAQGTRHQVPALSLLAMPCI